jgi:O-antigen/teichoic acid export membrane protein
VSRLRQFANGVGLSWLATFATVFYSLLSVPIALKYLSVDEFGLFVLLLQVAGYFSLIEIGMSASTSRILVDYKDNRDDGHYGSVIQTGFLVFCLQSFIVLGVGMLAAPMIVAAIGVPSALADVATLLVRWLAFTSALTYAFRIFGSVLYANKRLDLIHGLMGGNMLISLVLLVCILAAGGGLSGLVFMFVAQAIVASLVPLLACYRLGLLPRRGCWGQPSMKKFRELFGFGKDVFLVNVGIQVLEASQLIIVTRTMGLAAAATWSVSTKLFTLVYQLITKFEGTAIVFFAEMMVRGEATTLSKRFRQIYQLNAGVAVLALAVVVAINQIFVSVWADPSLAWPLQLSAVVAVLVFLNALTRCGADLIIHTKKIAAFRYIYFAEAIVFVLLAISLTSRFGFYGILGASLTCLLLFRATYTTWRMSHYFKLPPNTFWLTWLKRPFVAALLMAPFSLTAALLASNVHTKFSQLIIASAWVGIPAAISLFLVVLPRDVRTEILHRLSRIPIRYRSKSTS